MPVTPPNAKNKKFLSFFSLIKIRYITTIIIDKTARYTPGICFDKKEKTKNNDDKNQNFLLFLSCLM